MAWVVDQKLPVGQFVSASNRARQYDFLQMSFVVSQNAGLQIDHDFVCNLNAYATRYISEQPGRYRRHYNVKVGQHEPSDWSLVYEEMEAFLNVLHHNWASWDAVRAASYALWGVNHVHPFCEGNGRTARALSYYVLCKKLNRWLPGTVTVLELIRTQHRNHHCEILQRMHDARKRPGMETSLDEMVALIDALVLEQIRLFKEEEAQRAANNPSTPG